MNLKRSPFLIPNKNARDLINAKDFSTTADLMRKQKDRKEDTKTVHYRRDLDSLGQFITKNLLLIKKKYPQSSINYKKQRETNYFIVDYQIIVKNVTKPYRKSKDKGRDRIKSQEEFKLDRIIGQFCWLAQYIYSIYLIEIDLNVV